MTERVKIKCDDCKFVEDCVDYGWGGCKKFTPAPSEPLTNEEWMKSLNTEELGCFICENFFHGACGECRFCEKTELRHHCILGEWLKQPHTKE